MAEAKRRSLSSAARRVPSIAEFFGEIRAEGFEEYVAEILHNRAWADAAGTTEERLLVRMLQAMGVAAVEALREAAVVGETESYTQAMKLLPRVMGHTALTAAASICRDDTPWLTLSTVLIEEFRFGARQAAAQMERQGEGAAS